MGIELREDGEMNTQLYSQGPIHITTVYPSHLTFHLITYVCVNQVLLYDDCGELLVSRFLKKDEVIESGGTLTFDTHLVDIGELEGICKPLRDLNIQRKDEKPTEKMGIQRQKASCNSSGTSCFS